METFETFEELLAFAKAGGFDKQPERKPVYQYHDDMKAELMANPEVKAAYDALEPEFERAEKNIQRRANGKRKYLMDYIPPQKNGRNNLYAAVMFAREKMREGYSPAYANGMAASKYRVSKSDVAHYTGQVAGTSKGRRH